MNEKFIKNISRSVLLPYFRRYFVFYSDKLLNISETNYDTSLCRHSKHHDAFLFRLNVYMMRDEEKKRIIFSLFCRCQFKSVISLSFIRSFSSLLMFDSIYLRFKQSTLEFVLQTHC